MGSDLQRAYKLIEQLKEENTRLHNRVAYLEYQHRQQITLPEGEDFSVDSSNPHYTQKQSPRIGRRRLAKSRYRKLYRLRLIVIAIALSTVFTTVTLAVSRLLLRHPGDLSVKQSLLQFIPFLQPRKNTEFVYNVTTPPNFKHSEKLQSIVNELVEIAADQNLPTQLLSITLIDAKTGEIAGYQQDELRYPASVVKMFWLVAIYAQIEKGTLAKAKGLDENIDKMIKKSDNNGASFILDKITDTESQPELKEEEFKIWLNKREKVNRFFLNAGYDGININQKTYPVPAINLTEPQGTELQMRGNPEAPIRNTIKTKHSARLIYEICVTKQAVSLAASQKMCELLKRDLRPESWGKDSLDIQEFNPIRGLLGEGLTEADIEFYSKAGLTSTSRHDAAVVSKRDGETVYVLAISGSDRAYAVDWETFPKMSRLVFNRMTAPSSLK